MHKLLAHVDHMINTEFSNFFVISLDLLKSLRKLSRNVSLTEFDCSLESFITKYGHQSRDEGSLDPGGLTIINPFQKDRIIVEQLGNDNVCASIALLLKMLNVVFVGGGLSMHFGVTSNDDTEVVSISLSDKSN